MDKLFLVAIATAGLSGCATSLSEHPEYQKLQMVVVTPESGAGPLRIRAELHRTSTLANSYLETGKVLTQEATVAGAGILGSGFYGAAVTAFNPAPTNLMAAALGLGSAQAWQTALKPAARSRIYIQGYRALECLHGAGEGLLEGADGAANLAKRLREGTKEDRRSIEGDLVEADALWRELESSPGPGQAALLARLTAVRTSLADLDVALKLEQNIALDAPNEIAKVRRQVESNIDRQLAGQAPDYAAALELMAASVKPKGATDGGGGGAPPPPGPAVAAADAGEKDLRDHAARIAALEQNLASYKRRAPNLAASAYASMGKCIAVAG